MDRLRREMDHLFTGITRSGAFRGELPAVNVWVDDDNAVVTAELPGVDPKQLDLSVKENRITIRGNREAEALKENEKYLRQERGTGDFVRTVTLPFRVEADKVDANYQKGILRLTLPRSAQDKARKITVKAA
jgi:HSP20 family protein